MTVAELRLWRKDAQRWANTEYGHTEPHRRIIMLIDEVERLSAMVDENEQRFGDYTRMPFGRYVGHQLWSIPDDYFEWWFKKNHDRGILLLEAKHAPGGKGYLARKAVKLFDYLVER